MRDEKIISVIDLIIFYGDDLILDNISFEVIEGEILVILGTSGCGKSTLLRQMVGLSHPWAGKIIIDGNEITSRDEEAFNRTIRKIGILFQSGALIGSMTLAENVALPIIEFTDIPVQSVENLVKMKLSMVGLTGYENHLPSEISGGMKKRAGLARAMALNPKILFLDEPTAGLDPVIAAEIDELILGINRSIGTTMVIVTHELDSIFKVAQRVIMLDSITKGILDEGDPRDLKMNSSEPFVRQFFNRQAGSAKK
ncbi:MAG: ATP-binding cassette domain-containing protein [Desulfobacterales bacterium]|jgi:phospholipid/cholesterol/gamma-HCH transport system ATP-binding protein|nr:ATP-binding cassette domain-containing protein [Desulfobacteraceae bacterium]MBT4363042.1 ATP-binding cassette domain-containing protein [Desulfobacteraceae bacterium]MBT7085808.1 ATP-binding cassette domain-containing protein [Desulfobacterales bacterium]MBT7697963.1 ATP-binding cassette domain-containing protein [Desulfobacterales bacterium]